MSERSDAPKPSSPADRPGGMVMALGAFLLWGLLPVYWKALDGVEPLVVASHRVLWSLLLLAPLVFARGTASGMFGAFAKPRLLLLHIAAAALLGFNWWLYIRATMNERILDGALGYFLNPLVFLLLGRLVFGETLNRKQQAAVVLATLGVALPVALAGVWPWIAICLAVTFALYGLLRKLSSLGAITGTALETVILLPLSAAALWLVSDVPIWERPPVHALLLVLSGVATATPLLLFAAAARRIRLGTLGILQFLGPTLQFLVGWAVYHEPMPLWRVLSFSLIWCGVGLYLSGMPRRQAGK